MSSPRVQQLSIQVVFEQLVERARERPQEVVRTHPNGVRLPDVWPHLEKFSVFVEYLDAVVRSIGDIDPSVAVGGDRVWKVELAGPGSWRAPCLQKLSIFVELRHS